MAPTHWLVRCALLAMMATSSVAASALEPFVASYDAYRGGRLAGSATLKVTPDANAARWHIDLEVRGTKGLARLSGLNIQQSTLFDVQGDQYRPLSQATTQSALFTGKRVVGTYDWRAMTAQWQGDVKKNRRALVALQNGDLSSLLVNLAVIRDAQPGRQLEYRVVDFGRTRDYQYAVAAQTEIVAVEGLSYDAMRVNRTNGGNDETIFWVAQGVPTPVRILQREDGEDKLDLRLIEYQGVQ